MLLSLQVHILYWDYKMKHDRNINCIKCIMIITSVVPPELPMELSLAVNNSMVKLLKQKFFVQKHLNTCWSG